MYFLRDDQRKILFGWSAKSGCSHVQNLFYFLQTGNLRNPIHRATDYRSLPPNLTIESYQVFLFIRNPYERLVSGFLDKYHDHDGALGPRHQWVYHHIPLTFTNFVDQLVKRDPMIDHHHFTPQTTEDFNDKIRYHTNMIVYDIKNIDYHHLENVFQTIIPPEVRNFRGTHIHKSTSVIDSDVYDLPIAHYYHSKPLTRCFYPPFLQEKVAQFYRQDLEFFQQKG